MAREFNSGEQVEALWVDGYYYKAVIDHPTKDGYSITYPEYDTSIILPKTSIRRLPQPPPRPPSPRPSSNVPPPRPTSNGSPPQLSSNQPPPLPSSKKSYKQKEEKKEPTDEPDLKIDIGGEMVSSEPVRPRFISFPSVKPEDVSRKRAVSKNFLKAMNKIVVGMPEKLHYKIEDDEIRELTKPQITKEQYEEISPEKRKRMEQTRKRVINELLQTEHSYVASLLIIQTTYLRELSGKSYNIDLKLLFSNINTLIQVHLQFESELEEKINASPQCIGGLFAKYASFFDVYTIYTANHVKASAYLRDLLDNNGKFKKCYEKNMSNPRLKGLSLESYLIMPVQRIPRYILLLKEINKNTPPNHTDIVYLKQGSSAIADLATNINNAVDLQSEESEEPGKQDSPRIGAFRSVTLRAKTFRIKTEITKLQDEIKSIKENMGPFVYSHLEKNDYASAEKVFQDTKKSVTVVEVALKQKEEEMENITNEADVTEVVIDTEENKDDEKFKPAGLKPSLSSRFLKLKQNFPHTPQTDEGISQSLKVPDQSPTKKVRQVNGMWVVEN